jgi:hypothetical protein
MERIDRSAGPVRWTEPKPETVFIFDIYGAVHEIACDRSAGVRAPRDKVEGEVTKGVIQRWPAAVALAILGLGIVAEPGRATERTPASGVHESW